MTVVAVGGVCQRVGSRAEQPGGQPAMGAGSSKRMVPMSGARWGWSARVSRAWRRTVHGSWVRMWSVPSTVMMTSRVWAPAWDWDPKLSLRAITVGRRPR